MIRSTSKFWTLCAVISIGGQQAWASANTNLDTTRQHIREIVVEENRLSTRFSAQNRNIQVFDQTLIQASPARSLNELLQLLPGVDLRQRGPIGSQADISLDGGSFEQTLVLVDGVKMLDAQTAHHALNLPIPLEAVERIEVIRGSAARVYGINSLTGAINIVTKKAHSTGIGAHLYAGTGFKRDTSKQDRLFHGKGLEAHLQWGGQRGQGGNHSVYASLNQSNGHRYNTAFDNYRALYIGELATTKFSALKLQLGTVQADFGANGFYAAPGDREAAEIVRSTFASISHPLNFADNRFQILPRLSYRYTDDDYRYFRHDLSRARSRHYNYSLSPELHATWFTPYGDWGLGVEMRKEHIESSNIGTHERNNYGAYFEYRMPHHNWLSLSAGTYLNYHSDFGWQWFPGVDAGLNLYEGLRLTAHAGTGQRIPSFTDLYLDQRPGNVGNPEVQPEQAWHVDAGVKWNKPAFRTELHTFYRNIDRFIDWVYELPGNPPYQPLNFNQNRVKGVSWNGQLDVTALTKGAGNETAGSNLMFHWHYTRLHPSYSPRSASKGQTYQSKYAMDVLRQHASFQLICLHEGFRLSTGLRYQQRFTYKDYWLNDWRFGYSWGGTEAYLDVQNAFDTKYAEWATAPLPGRWLHLGLKYRWSK